MKSVNTRSRKAASVCWIMCPSSCVFAALTVSAATLLTLAGCGGDDPLEESSKATPSAASTPKEQAKAEEMPSAAKEHTPAGGVEFVKYYFDQVNKGFDSGEYATLVRITDSGCIICRQTIGDIAFAYTVGSIEGGKITVENVEAGSTKENSQAVSLDYEAEKYSEVDSEGETIFSVPERDLAFVVQLKWSDGRWLMSQIAQAKVDKD